MTTFNKKIPFSHREKIYVAGHQGMVGSAIVRKLCASGYNNLIFKTHDQLDLRDQAATFDFFKQEQPDCVFLAAARVGGIAANNADPSGFLDDNARISLNIIDAALAVDVPHFMYFGSSCIYPRMAEIPLKESSLLTGSLEPTNEGYALAKILGLLYVEYLNRKGRKNWISVMPANLYGKGDSFDPSRSHVIPALFKRFTEARDNNDPFFEVWGSGKALREFMYIDDCADACLFLIENGYDDPEFINIGTGITHSIGDLAHKIAEIVGYEGEIRFDTSKPDGTPKRLLDNSKLETMGWHYKIDLDEGLHLAYEDYINRFNN